MAALLGIDFGERRIGLAVSDSSGILATPLDTIDTRKSEPFITIKDYAEEYDADTLVVGYPLRTDGTAGEKAAVVDEFIKSLALVCPGKKIVKQDERYSSSDAHALIRNSGRKKGKKPIDKSIIDRMAAAIILQEYIDSNKMKQPMNICIAALLIFISFAVSACDSVRYTPAREKPLTPKLLELLPGTKNDSIAAVILKFSHTDTLPSTIRVESAKSDTVFELEVYDIPPLTGKYASEIKKLSENQYLSNLFYKIYAASRKGILSDPSDTLSIQLLDKPPVIDSVVIRENCPVIYYTVYAQQGLTRRVAITMDDSVIIEKEFFTPTFTPVTQFTQQWTNAPLDSLRIWNSRAGRVGKPFGLRVIVELPNNGKFAYGVAAASLHLPPL